MKIILSILIILMIISFPLTLKANTPDALEIEERSIELSSENDPPIQMTQEEIDILLGPEPYLGPTSWIESKKDKLKKSSINKSNTD